MENEIRTKFSRIPDGSGGTHPQYTVFVNNSLIATVYRAKDIEPAIANFIRKQ